MSTGFHRIDNPQSHSVTIPQLTFTNLNTRELYNAAMVSKEYFDNTGVGGANLSNSRLPYSR
jgi:hypothetical protein